MAEAKRRRGEIFHHDKMGDSRAICTFNTARGESDKTQPAGWIQLTQRTEEDGSLANTHVEAYMGHLVAGTDYGIEVHDDDQDDCQGSLMSEVGTFTANEKGRGKLIVEDIVQDIDGDESVVGAWLQVNDASGTQVGCCEIIEYQDYWLRKKAVEFGQQ